jgi:hypothetical protein
MWGRKKPDTSRNADPEARIDANQPPKSALSSQEKETTKGEQGVMRSGGATGVARRRGWDQACR